MSQWQDISTAPKDGTSILVWSNMHGGGVFIARWKADQYAKKPRPYWTFNDERVWGTVVVRDCQPSHWMPLPPAPEAKP